MDAAAISGLLAGYGIAMPVGGIAIFLSFLLSLGIALLVSSLRSRLSLGSSIETLATILGPGLLIFLLGVYDDMRGASPYLKFAVQAIAGALLFAGGLRILDLPVLFGGHHFSWIVGLPLTILWVLAITNAFNLIDGLDGLAARPGSRSPAGAAEWRRHSRRASYRSIRAPRN